MAISLPRTAAEDPADDLADRVLRQFLVLCESPRTRKAALRMVHGSLGSARGARAFYRLLNRFVLSPVVRSSGLHTSTVRVELVGSQLIGLAMMRYVLKVEPVASMSIDELVPMAAPSIRATLASSPGRPAARPAYRPGVVPDWDELGPAVRR